ncbi:MAG: hypothetical protein RBG13Loki_2108 [Promethearchaeota archaeon CR_4]|nr:MAG: hypothetical protein RBG13Loki_2108 [Candidatus Lokiarchaeota archaeon CR_4]
MKATKTGQNKVQEQWKEKDLAATARGNYLNAQEWQCPKVSDLLGIGKDLPS